jgi:uncharacterized protein YyaL (SSP411 family)
MSNWLNSQFIPNGIITIIEDKSQLEKLQRYSFFKGRNFDREDKSECAFVCRNFTCSLPIYSIQELEKQIKSNDKRS